jgi:orotate phosphoribosyltransferase
MKQLQRDFIEFAIDLGVLKFGKFILKSGRESPYFFNFGLFNTGAALDKIGTYYAKTISDSHLSYNVLFGPAYKGIPLVAATSICLSRITTDQAVPYAFNRKEAKDHGEGGSIVGTPLSATSRVIIVDDVITAGNAIRESLHILSHYQAVPVGVITALDRQEKGMNCDESAIQQVEKELHIPVVPIIRFQDIIEYLEETGKFADQLDKMKEYRQKYGV